MRGLPRAAVDHPIAMVIALAITALAGVYAALRLPVDLFPGLDVPVVNVISHDPAAAPEDMEHLVTRPLEARLRGIPGVRRVASESTQGLSRITVEFDWGTRLADARQLVQAVLSSVRPDLPPGVEPVLENIGTTLEDVAEYTVSGGGDPIELRTTVRLEVASRLTDVPGVSRVTVLGGDTRAFVVTLRPEALTRLGLGVSGVVEALRTQNVAGVEGFLVRGAREYLLRGDARLTTIDDVRQVRVNDDPRHPILLGDVATVSEGRSPRHYTVREGGVPAVSFLVRKQPDASAITVVRDVDRRLDELKPLLPPGAVVRKAYDQSEIIVEARDDLVDDLLIGALLAIVVLLVFLGALRTTLVVAAAIPVTLLATLALMWWSGLTLNVVTLSALTLAVGMVVDDAIIVAENIFRRRRGAEGTRLAAIEGADEIAPADAAGTFTTVAAFVPLVLVGGIAGLFARPFGIVIGVALLASLAVSLTFVPAMLARSRVTRSPGDSRLGWLARPLDATLGFAFRHRVLVVVLGAAALALGGFVARAGPVRVLPPIDEGAVLVEYVMPPGTSLAESDRVGHHLEQIAEADPDVETVSRRTGSPAEGFQVEGVNMGEMTMKLAPRAIRVSSADQVLARLRAEYSAIPGIVVLYHQPTQEKIDESFSGLPALFGVTVFGPDADELVTLAGKLESVMARDPALANLVNNTKVPAPQITVRLDRAALARRGVDAGEVLATLRAARFGVEATRIVLPREEVSVLVRVGGLDDESVAALRQLPVPAPGGPVPLERVARIEIAHAPASITRRNGQREVTILAEVEGSIPAAVARLGKAFAAVPMPKGYSVAFTGEYAVVRQTAIDFLFAALAAAVLIYLIMVMQFRSWGQPLAILVTIPFSLVGGVVALTATGVGLDVSVAMGALTLIGVAVNNAIVLVDFANREAAGGKSMREALRSAARVRLRPILMTALTSIAGLLPIALSPTVGSQIFRPFAVTVIGGLITGTLATLVLVPTLIATGRPRARA